MATELGMDIGNIITDSVNKAFCLEDTDRFPVKAYVPKLMSKIEQKIPLEWTESFQTSFIKNSNYKVEGTRAVSLKNYININMDYDNILFEDFKAGDNIAFKFKDQDIRKLYFDNRRSFDKKNDSAVLFVNDGSSYEDANSRYSVRVDSSKGYIEISTSNNTFKGPSKSIILDQKNNEIKINNGNTSIRMTDTKIIMDGTLVVDRIQTGSCNLNHR